VETVAQVEAEMLPKTNFKAEIAAARAVTSIRVPADATTAAAMMRRGVTTAETAASSAVTFGANKLVRAATAAIAVNTSALMVAIKEETDCTMVTKLAMLTAVMARVVVAAVRPKDEIIEVKLVDCVPSKVSIEAIFMAIVAPTDEMMRCGVLEQLVEIDFVKIGSPRLSCVERVEQTPKSTAKSLLAMISLLIIKPVFTSAARSTAAATSIAPSMIGRKGVGVATIVELNAKAERTI
jgi:hypothetical protein